MASGDVGLKRGSWSALSIDLASLATSSSFVAGRSSAARTVSSDEPIIDYLLAGKIRVGTTPTTNTQIQIWAYAAYSETPTYPDTIDGTDSNKTLTSVGIRNGALHQVAVLEVDSNTTDRDYPIKPVSIASLFGGVLPKHWGIFVAHNTGVNLNSTSGNHVINVLPIYGNVAA